MEEPEEVSVVQSHQLPEIQHSSNSFHCSSLPSADAEKLFASLVFSP